MVEISNTQTDPLLLALVQDGLRDQLSGLEPELREGEKAVIFASRSRWVLPLDLTRDPRSQFYTPTE